MLFNSWNFVFIFLPISVITYYLAKKVNKNLPQLFLVMFSFLFYSYWSSKYLILLMSSIVINYIFGRLIANYHFSRLSSRRNILITALTLNLMCLAYFKYCDFFLSNIRSVVEIEIQIPNIILPLGISFFTFTQIAFLIDAYYGKVKSFNFIHYCQR